MLIRSQDGSTIVLATLVWMGPIEDDGSVWGIDAASTSDTGSVTVGEYLSKVAAQAALDEIWENARRGKDTDLSRAVGE